MVVENLPYNDQAERTVLGALLTDGDINTLIGEVGLQASDFYVEANKVIYTAALQLYEENEPIDFVTVNAKLQGNYVYGGIEYLKSIMLNVPTVRHLKYYADIVKEMSQRRNYIALAVEMQNIAADCNKDIGGIDDVIEKVIMTENRDTGIISFADAFVPVYMEIVKAYENKGKIPYQKTGFMSLDTALGGMKGLIVIGARPGMGKTILGTNIAEYVAFQEDKAWWNGDALYEITDSEFKLDTNREAIVFAEEMIEDSKLMGVKGTFTFTLRKIFSRGREYAEAYSRGEDPRFEVIDQLKDPDAYGKGYEKVQYFNCWLDSVPLTSHKSGSVVEETYSGGFTGFKFLSSIDPVAQD